METEFNTIKKTTIYGECRTDLDGYSELIRLPFDMQREILCEVINMMDEYKWRQKHRDELIKEVIEVSINRYYPEQITT